MKRFWKQAWVKEDQGMHIYHRYAVEFLLRVTVDGCTVMLDKRNLRTPGGRHIVRFPASQRPLAYLTAAEWEQQTETLKAHSLPLVSNRRRCT